MKSRIAIIAVSVVLTVGKLAFAAGMKHCHSGSNHGQLSGVACGETSHHGNCHSIENQNETQESQ